MKLYEEIIENFKKDVDYGKIADKISNVYEDYYNHRASPSEINSWVKSLSFLKEALETASLSKNRIIIEYELPYSEKRIDVILFGEGESGDENIIIIELKQWSNEHVEDSESEGNIIVDFGKFKKEMPHPSLQTEGYYWYLKDFMTVFEEQPGIILSACVYCHNYSKGDNEILYLPKFNEEIKKYPLFSKEDMKELGRYLHEKLSKGDGFGVFGKFNKSIFRPSKKLLEHTKEMINKQQVFNLIDEQRTAYNTIVSKVKSLSKTQEKSVIIIKGGPGTGKSVIALEIMGELLKQGKNVVHATGSKTFTSTLRKIVGVRAAKQFRYFNGFLKNKEDDIEVLICDEAHRIRKSSEGRYTPSQFRTGKPQIDELIKVAKLSIFFIDEHQIVRPDEIGSVKLIRESAEKFEAKVYEPPELKTQFRCGGSGKYLGWVEKMLQIKEEGEEIESDLDEKMEFKVVDSPEQLKEMIDQKNKEKKNSARLVAGYCWHWSRPKHDGSLVNDVKIGNFEMPWENKNDFWKWATDDSGMEQVGTVYTSQGFEFDYIGIIFGKDLIWNKEKNWWEAKPENSHDPTIKNGGYDVIKHLKNVYRVLLSRAHKGVYVYFMDKDTEEYFRSKATK